MKPVVLPAGGEWMLTHWLHDSHAFLVATNPNHSPRVIGRTANGEVFIRLLTEQEKAVVG